MAYIVVPKAVYWPTNIRARGRKLGRKCTLSWRKDLSSTFVSTILLAFPHNTYWSCIRVRNKEFTIDVACELYAALNSITYAIAVTAQHH